MKNKVFALAEDIRRDFLARTVMLPGGMLPPLRELAAKYQVAYMTVQRAVQHLAEQQLLEVKQGSGIRRPDRDDELRLCILLPAWFESSLSGSTTYDIVRGLSEITTFHNWHTQILSLKVGGLNTLDAWARLEQTGCNRVVWLTPEYDQRLEVELLTRQFKEVVVTERPFHLPGVVNFHLDYNHLARNCLRLFMQQGRRRLILLCGPYYKHINSDSYSDAVIEAFLRAAGEMNFDFSLINCFQTHPLSNHREQKLSLRSYLAQEQPDAVVMLNNTMIEDLVNTMERIHGARKFTVVDFCYQSRPFYDGEVGSTKIYRVARPNYQMGQAIGRYFEHRVLGHPTAETQPLIAKLF